MKFKSKTRVIDGIDSPVRTFHINFEKLNEIHKKLKLKLYEQETQTKNKEVYKENVRNVI